MAAAAADQTTAATPAALAGRPGRVVRRRPAGPTAGGGGGGGAGAGAGGGAGPGGGAGAHAQVVWTTRNVRDGIVQVDQSQLSRLIKRQPIHTFYEVDEEPFATGQFANVRRCRSRATGQEFAAKFSSRERYGEDCSAEIHHEIALLSLCSPSPRVIRLQDVFETRNEIILVMEFAPGGDLQSLLDANVVPYESDVAAFTRQLLEGLVYLHQRRIAHLDIKPQNLVMMGDFPTCDVKLCDLEISRVIPEGAQVRELLGTPDYVAPEILQYEPITTAADMWSLGVTVYVLLTGFSPFGGETDQETFCNISRAQLDFPDELFEDVSEPAKDFLRRLLVRDPRARPTAKECLRHPWLQSRTSAAPATARSGCASCSAAVTGSGSSPANQRNLRKYLSKSREALFERVVQRQQQQEEDERRQDRPPTRLCESHASLVSRTRPHALSPSFSRSREKLYGLRSLSRSHEVLAMVRTLSAMQLAVPTSSGDGSAPKKFGNDSLEEAIDKPGTPSRLSPSIETSQAWSTVPSAPLTADNQSEQSQSRENGLCLGAIPEEAGSEPTSLSMPASAASSDTADENANSADGENGNGGVEEAGEEEEPRYTVAQLISAYNLHQEVATKSPNDIKDKVVVPGKFPTGPNALRLFIPVPDVTVSPKSNSSTLH